MNSLDFSKIKLVIWDLDNTFWKGIISETAIEPIDSHLQLVRRIKANFFINHPDSWREF